MNNNINNNNGRIDIITPNINNLFDMKDKIPNQTFDYRDALNGNWYKTKLSDLFFSKENIEIIQNGIRIGVYKMSNNNYIIDKQDYDEIKVIMRSVFLQNSKNKPCNITEQITKLNKIVLEYAIKQVYGEAQGYIKYKYDISNIHEPIAYPVMSKLNNKQLQLKKWF
jgi:hypothetical protein